MKQKLMWDKLCEARQFFIDSTTDKSQVKLEEGWNGTVNIVQVTFKNGSIVADAVSDFKELRKHRLLSAEKTSDEKVKKHFYNSKINTKTVLHKKM